jgi:hypothetical protein
LFLRFHVQLKMVYSLCIAAAGMMLLAFCSAAGGNAQSAYYEPKSKVVNPAEDDHIDASWQALRSGYGTFNRHEFTCVCLHLK